VVKPCDEVNAVALLRHIRCRDGEVGGLRLKGRGVNFLAGLIKRACPTAPYSSGMGRKNDWIADWIGDWIGDWNKWSSAERVLALLIATLALALPLSSLLWASR
jgi:hypothetical protein